MKSLTAVLLASTLIGTGFVLPLAAQTTPAAPAAASGAPVPAAPAPAPDPAAAEHAQDEARRKTRTADRAALFEAHLAALHAGLTLTPEQDKMWPPVEQAIRGFAQMRSAMRDTRMDARQDREEGEGDDPIVALETYSEGLLQRAQTLKALSDAAQPLYAALREDQKHRLPMLLRDMAPKHGPVARMVDRLGDEEEGATGMQGRDLSGAEHRWRRMDHEERGMDDGERRGHYGMADREDDHDGPRSMDRGGARDGESFHRRERMHGWMGQDDGDSED